MNGKGCAGSIASGVSSGKILWRKWSSIQAALGFGDVLAVDQHDAARPVSSSRRSRQIACWSLASVETVSLISTKLFRRRQSIGAALGDAFADLGLDAGDADHEELIKVVGGNRQESHPFQRGMARD